MVWKRMAIGGKFTKDSSVTGCINSRSEFLSVPGIAGERLDARETVVLVYRSCFSENLYRGSSEIRFRGL